jgi:hypothetical protein
MSLPSYLRRFFGKSAEPAASSPTPNEVQIRLFNATGPRAKVGQLLRVSDTGSMGGNFKAGDVVEVSDFLFDFLKVGDLVVRYDESTKLNTMHPVVSWGRAANGELYYVTKGTANAGRDSNMVRSEYVGVAKLVNAA